MFQTDLKPYEKLENDLGKMSKTAGPIASNIALNRAAFTGREISISIARHRMIFRNTWTERSIRVERSKGLRISEQGARLGSTEDYMATQEFGGVKRATRGSSVAIPTPQSAGESALPRRKLPMKANAMKNIRLRKQGNFGQSRAQRNRIAIAQAANSKGRNKFVYLDLGRRSGIFKVTGRKSNIRLVKMQNLGNKLVTIPRREWLKPAVDRVGRRLPRYYTEALQQQAQRLGLFK